jgi:hypothetical protein
MSTALILSLRVLGFSNKAEGSHQSFSDDSQKHRNLMSLAKAQMVRVVNRECIDTLFTVARNFLTYPLGFDL